MPESEAFEELTLEAALANAINQAIEQFEVENQLELDQLTVVQALTLTQYMTIFPEDEDEDEPEADHEADIGAGV